MGIHLEISLLLCLQIASYTASTELVKEMRQPQTVTATKQATGHATLCDGLDLSKINAKCSWTMLSSPSRSLDVSFDYTFGEDFEKGTAEIDVFTKLCKADPWEIATGLEQEVTCEDLEGKLKSSSFNLRRTPSKCPYKKNDRIQGSTTFTDLRQIPFGYNSAIVKIKNVNNKVFLCLNATIYIEMPADYGDPCV